MAPYQMLRLFRTSHRYLFQTSKYPNNSNSLIPMHHQLHIPPKTQRIPDSVSNELPSPNTFQQLARESGQHFDQTSSMKRETCMVHPWPEWVEWMQHLYKNGYLEEKEELDANRIRTACLNFARDRAHLIRYFSSKDIQVIAGYGCPVIDRKVVNAGKRLRARVGIDEGNVCNSCILRGNCKRAYAKACASEGGGTVDVMRLLLTYGLDLVTGVVENKCCLNKVVKESVRRLLKEMVEHSKKELTYDPPTAISTKWDSSVQESSIHQGEDHIRISMKQGGCICSKCKFRNFARNTKCLHCDRLFQERQRKLRADQDRLALKKGDWLCDECNFFNYAKNTRCLQCNENPPKRQLNPGEWECDSCNYINFRRNMVCIKCDHRRPRVSYSGGTYAQSQHDNWSHHHPQPSGREGVNMQRYMDDERNDNDGSNSPDLELGQAPPSDCRFIASSVGIFARELGR
ncbi:Zinc finger protein [Actinidia chinensis var. chinensis]|uniref:Zinc finger protein n=1 Tax=Actinidia chinensis var. chinensis TaxID=1590841 RepID=A0A2R6QQG9_ACTCC|nr:Zinc finger protein [Actinidia chinensis var. chinensis]